MYLRGFQNDQTVHKLNTSAILFFFSTLYRNTMNSATVGILVAPHVVYSFLWWFPRKWVRLCKYFEELITNYSLITSKFKVHPSHVVGFLGHLMKLTQAWYLFRFRHVVLPKPVHPSRWLDIRPYTLANLCLLGAGQTLNASVYRNLGTVGVYYGKQFGYPVPWVHGFPFQLGDYLYVPHPQYTGAILTILSMPHLFRLPWKYALVWVASYLATMSIETHPSTAKQHDDNTNKHDDNTCRAADRPQFLQHGNR